MKKLKMYCLTTRDEDLELIKSLGYLPVGLGKNIKSNGFLKDNYKDNIFKKNDFYGEYTFHYWIWKITWINWGKNGLVFVNIENFGLKLIEILIIFHLKNLINF